MTQWEYDTIMMALDGGVPAIADKLGMALQGLVQENAKLREENGTLKKEKEELEASKEDCSCENQKDCKCGESVEEPSSEQKPKYSVKKKAE